MIFFFLFLGKIGRVDLDSCAGKHENEVSRIHLAPPKKRASDL